MTTQQKELFAIPLGGLDEIGLNMMLYECGDDMIIVDCGLTFADEFSPGVDVIIPDISYVRENIHKLKGIFFTHAHEDHIGALPYLWEELKSPIYCSAFSAQMIGGKLERFGIPESDYSLNVVKRGEKYEAGCFSVEFIDVTHSVPGSTHLVIRTPHGVIYNTGDYKLDEEPVLGGPSNLERAKQIAEEDVLAVFGDSTEVFRKGRKVTETDLSKSLDEIIGAQEKAVFVSPIGSNFERMLSISEIAVRHGRKICFFGRTLQNVVQYARNCNMMPDHLLKHMVDSSEVRNIPREQILVFVTGAQGQHNAMLNRLADGQEFRGVQIHSGDTVILSARKIPGCELDIARVENKLAKIGVRTLDRDSAFVHVGGHGQREEAVELYKLLDPKYIIPSYGTAWHNAEHERMVKEEKLNAETRVIENGHKLKLAPGTPEVVGSVQWGRNYVDGLNILDEDRFVLKERRQMSFEGLATVTAVVDLQSKALVARPKVSSKGLIDESLQPDVINACQEEVMRSLRANFGDDVRIDDPLRAEEIMRNAVRRAMKRERGRKPLTIPQIIEI